MLVKWVVIWSTMGVILTSATTSTERSQRRNDPRIHGGRPVEMGEFPFLVLLQIATEAEENQTCSGSIPSRSTVLTAAHCDVGDITAYAGLESTEQLVWSHEVQVRNVESVAKPEYPAFYDIMICYLNNSWEWNQYVKPVALHLSAESRQPSFVISCQVIGFGQTEPDSKTGKAHVMKQLIGSSSQCLDVHPFIWFFSFWMCSINVRNKTMCVGDSGGPAICNGKQWAVNMGVTPVSDKECLPTKTANVYVATTSFRNWIINYIRDLPSSRGYSIHHRSVKISMYEVLLNQPPLWLLLLMVVELLYFL